MRILPLSPMVRFGTIKPQQKLYYCSISNGDGTFSPVMLNSKEEAEKLSEIIEEEMEEGAPEVDEVKTIYESAQEYLDTRG